LNSSISARAQLTIKAKRRERRQRSKASTEASTSVSKEVVPNTEPSASKEVVRVPLDAADPFVDDGQQETLNDASVLTEESAVEMHMPKRFETVNEDSNHGDVLEGTSYLPFDEQQELTSREDEQPRPKNAASISVESPTTVPSPVYYKFIDDDQEVLKCASMNTRPSRNIPKTPPPLKMISRSESKSKPRLILPQSRSPSSHDTGSHSKTTSQSLNTSSQSARSVTSSVAEADREVREVNRKGRQRSSLRVDLDETVSIYSADSASTHAYLALDSSPALREGANVPIDRFFRCSASVTSNSSTGGDNCPLEVGAVNSRPRSALRHPRSPVTVSSSHSFANNTYSSSSTGEDPPRFVSLPDKQKPKTVPVRVYPPRSASALSEKDSLEESVGYSKLGYEEKAVSTSSSSSSSHSNKDKTRKYHKIVSSPVAERTPSSTPTPYIPTPVSPSGSSTMSAPISPPSRFIDSHESQDLQKRGAAKPQVLRRVSSGNSAPSLGEAVYLPPTPSISLAASSSPSYPLFRPRIVGVENSPMVEALSTTRDISNREPAMLGHKEYQSPSPSRVSPE